MLPPLSYLPLKVLKNKITHIWRLGLLLLQVSLQALQAHSSFLPQEAHVRG